MAAARRSHLFRVILFGLVLIGLLLQIGVLHSIAPLERLFLPIDDGRSLLNGVPPDLFARCAASQQRVAVGIIAAAANRSESLLRVIPSWLATNEVSEVVLVDWSSSPPVSSLPLPTDPRLRIVRAAGEFEWNLARAYNLALQLSNAEIVLKVDSDTWLDPEVLRIQLPRVAIVIGGTSGAFLRGCRDDAPDENARHLNGVILARRDDLLRVRGYDERMRKYGFDDTDLYARLSQARNLTGGCLRFDLMRHSPDGHAERGLTRVHHTLNKRATRGGLFPGWHEALNLEQTFWSAAAADSNGGALVSCTLVSTRRPPFFDELLVDSDELLSAHQEALVLYSKKTLKLTAVSTIYDRRVLDTLMRVYDSMLNSKQPHPYIAVRPMHGLASRMRAYCSAYAYAQMTGRRLLVVWEPDLHTNARFDELFEVPSNGNGGNETEAPIVEVIHSFQPSLFPAETWRRFDQIGSEKQRKRNMVSADEDGRSLFVSTASKLEASPSVNRGLYAQCLSDLRPVAAVRAMLVDAQELSESSSWNASSQAVRRVGVHIRMKVNPLEDVPGLENQPESSLKVLSEAKPYRMACHYSNFLQTMRQWRSVEPSMIFYLASDSHEAYREVLNAFEPGIVLHSPQAMRAECAGGSRNASDAGLEAAPLFARSGRRGVACQQAALADILNLRAYSDRLLLSHWSSWADVLMNLAPLETPHQNGCKAMGNKTFWEPRATGDTDAVATSTPTIAVRPRNGVASEVKGGGALRWRSQPQLYRDSPPPLPPPPPFPPPPPLNLGKDLLKASGRPVPGMTMRKVSSLSALPSRPNDVRVRVHKSKEVSSLLPKAVRDLKLVLLVPRQVKVGTLVSRVKQMLQLTKAPLLRVRSSFGRKGEALDPSGKLGGYYEDHHDAKDGFLHVDIELN